MSNPFEFTIEAKKLALGLRPDAETPRDTGFLVECVGSVGQDEILSALDEISRMNLSGFYFPYPQVFVLKNMILVCDSSHIYEWINSSLVLKFTSSLSGHRWHLVDYGEFLYLSNSKVAITRDVNGVYSETATLPIASAICNMNGQIVISGKMNGLITYLTSRPYAIEVEEFIDVSSSITEIEFPNLYNLDPIDVSAGISMGVLRVALKRLSINAEEFEINQATITSGGLIYIPLAIVKTIEFQEPEEIDIPPATITSGSLIPVMDYIEYSYGLPESIDVSATITGGSLG